MLSLCRRSLTLATRTGNFDKRGLLRVQQDLHVSPMCLIPLFSIPEALFNDRGISADRHGRIKCGNASDVTTDITIIYPPRQRNNNIAASYDAIIMFVNYFITIYLHNYIVHVLFAYYYTACIIVIITLFGDARARIFRTGRSERTFASRIFGPGNNQSLFYRVAHLIAGALRHQFENG